MAEGDGLLNRCTGLYPYRGFESPLLRFCTPPAVLSVGTAGVYVSGTSSERPICSAICSAGDLCEVPLASPQSVRSPGTFRVGRVSVYSRGKVWYLRYHEHGQRQQVRASGDRAAARQLAAQVNVQIETGVPAATSFEPISVADLRVQWLEHHEGVKRSSVHTISRYRTATAYLVRFLQAECRHMQKVSQFGPREVESFARWLRTIKVAPNGHKHSATRRLLDKGILYILQACRSLLQYAIKRRHLPPYSENPFSSIRIESITIENARPIVLLTVDEERSLLGACDPWAYPPYPPTLATTAPAVTTTSVSLSGDPTPCFGLLAF